MANVTFLLPDGEYRTLDVPIGTSLMRAAIQDGIDAIVGDCGGNLACATCHVFVEPAQLHWLEPSDPREAEMLEYTAAPRTDSSRLCCQILVQDKCDGLVVRVADPQV